MIITNQPHFFFKFFKIVLITTLLTSTPSVQALTQLNGTASIQALILLAGMAASQVIDENEDIDMDSLGLSLAELFDLEVTIATGVKQTVARAPAVTSVITAQDIERIGATTLDEILETVPGLHVEYAPYGSSIFNIRGIYSLTNSQVLVLINGVPSKTMTYSSHSFLYSPLVNAINRIEIIRGPGSAVYGADAFAGVINIITKTKKDIEGTETGVRLGSFDTKEVWALHGGHYGGFDVAWSLDYQSTDGHKEIIDVDAQTQYDELFNTQASHAPGPVNLQKRSFDAYLDISKGNWRLRSGFQGRYDVGDMAGAANALDPSASYWEKHFNMDLIYQNQELTNNWEITGQLSYFYNEWESQEQTWFPAGAFGGAYPDGYIFDNGTKENHTRLNISSIYSGFKQHIIRLGAGYHYSDLFEVKHFTNVEPATGLAIPYTDFSDTAYTFIPEVDRDNWHVFLQDIWSLTSNIELTLGIRYDKYSDFGATTNPRLALMWQPRPNLTTKLLYGSAFRAPGIADQYLNAPTFRGNPNVEPETIDTWELAFNYRATENLHLATNLFTYKWSDGIVYGPGETQGTFKIANLATQKGHGLEFETRWQITKAVGLLANYAFTKATNENTNHDAGNYPQHSAYLRTDWLIDPKWSVNTQLIWIGENKRSFGDPRTPVDDYTTVDLTLRYQETKGHWNFAASVQNLFDADARVPSSGPDADGMIAIPHDLPLAGRHYWLEMRYRF
jgi:outer membrane cobalamin receptor